MRTSNLLFRTCFVSCLTILSMSGCAKSNAAPTPVPEVAKPLTPEAMEAAFKAAGTTGADHARLATLVGTWKVDTKWWMSPDAQPQISHGRAVYTSVLGAKYIRQDFTGQMMGQPFEGIGYTGYDNVAKEYTAQWMDSMSTSSMLSTGQYDATKNGIVFSGSMSCPLTNAKRTMKSICRFIDKNKHIFEMYDLTPDGREFMVMQIEYTRAK